MFRHLKNEQSGQTLVETVVGIVIMTVGIGSAVGLSSYVFGNSASAQKQLIASGLAREGIEAVFNMRATNWLRTDLDTNCYDYVQGTNTALCRNDWLDPGNDFNNFNDGQYYMRGDSGGRYYRLDVQIGQDDDGEYWRAQRVGVNSNFQLNVDTTATVNSGRLYVPANVSGTGIVASDYYRQIYIEEQTAAPYNTNVGPRLRVYSRVWWNDKGCATATSTWPTTGRCRIELMTYLTNWKNY